MKNKICFYYKKDKITKKGVVSELKNGKEVIFLDTNGRKIVTFNNAYQFRLYSDYYAYLFR